MKGLILPSAIIVVHDQVCMTLVAPGCFILTPAMLKIEHRIAFLFILVVTWRGINKCPAGGVCAPDGKQNLLHFTVRHIFKCIEILVMSRYLYAAFPAGGTIEI